MTDRTILTYSWFEGDRPVPILLKGTTDLQSTLTVPRSFEIIDLNDPMEDRWPEICMCATLMTISLPV